MNSNHKDHKIGDLVMVRKDDRNIIGIIKRIRKRSENSKFLIYVIDWNDPMGYYFNNFSCIDKDVEFYKRNLNDYIAEAQNR